MRSFLMALLLVVCASGCDSKQIVKPVDLTDEISTVNNIFSKVEKDILNIEPAPTPDENEVKPDPDKNKCACRGTGEIVHGDGHTTPCPFHSIGLNLQK